ncbi:MAG TPA: excinuclease ABC subunit UvrC, partial [Rhodopila sp.]|nr:excinuclease ABC subunit UvrC [Rhodopila sp.]
MTTETGVAVIEAALETMSASPGVYRMLDAKGDALYVGKARSLKRRVHSYTQIGRLPERLRRMVSETVAMETVTTHTEAEALLLEANLIKRLKPRFNIVLRDDKSYPWLMLTEDHPYPQIVKHRGAQVRKASYWGPFASAWAVNQTVTAMQRVFLLRSCADTVFSARSRPCLLFQIKRCSAPCVGRIEAEDYAKLVAQAKSFLAGKATTVQKELAAEMEQAAEALEFERAAAVRDRLRGLTFVQGSSVINPASLTDADVIAAWQIAGQTCVQVFFVRGGRNNGNRAFYPTHTKAEEAPEVLSAFIAQFYDDKPPPPLLLVNHELPEHDLIAEALSLKAGRKVEISVPQRGEKRAVVLHAETNAREALERKLAESAGQAKLLQGVQDLFKLPTVPERIEVYDNSHIMGTNPYGVMIVAGPEGFIKAAYRKFGIRGPITPGDDFGMMREMLQRRFSRALKEQAEGEPPPDWPDLLLIDGGAGQLTAARDTLADLGVFDVKVVAIAKGPDRNAGREWLHMDGMEPL